MELSSDSWPALPLASWKDTCDTLHLWTQIVGKVKLALSPFVNHWWHVTLHVAPRGLTTGDIPWRRGRFAMTFDFVAQELRIDTSEGDVSRVQLRPRTVANFYRELFGTLGRIGIDVAIWPMPVEMPDNHIPLDRDETHAAYDAEAVRTFWRVLLIADRALKEFRSSFLGKCSPVHFFWGSVERAGYGRGKCTVGSSAKCPANSSRLRRSKVKSSSRSKVCRNWRTTALG